ncbi:protein-disulfide isomerase [Rhodovulum imhoffii]|uniref:Protein-disulfide isomerase n=1 Tax=Rhodovulum imhoffii TaxID=365340 RepID=A0A2T5BVU8_9RHOB|nr:DsbA family protein [Rhodovulum imhoffii]MBK5933219.1 disulfide bond formation protein DsbA [Rhodovulum imhoffii]PTN03680.1 protein-disulfide isomerase [Rhodovulum imhoffii]
MIRPALTAAAFGLVLAAPAGALDLTNMSGPERDAFRDEVRAYLLDHPEVLMEAISVLEQRQAEAEAVSDAELIAVNAEDIFNDPHSFVGGNPQGDVTLVEFTDYRCPYCRKAHEEVKKLLEADGNVRFVLKEFPILSEDSVRASRFAIATLQTEGNDAYRKVSDALIHLRGPVNESALRQIAEDAGFDPAPSLARMEAPEIDDIINENRELAQRLQISGTPTFILKSQMIRGYVPLAELQETVANERAQ